MLLLISYLRIVHRLLCLLYVLLPSIAVSELIQKYPSLTPLYL